MTKLLLFFLRIKGHFLKLLPRKVQLLFGYIFGVLLFDIFRIRRNVIMDNLKIAFPEKSESERAYIGRMSVVSMGHSIIEYFLMLVFDKIWLEKMIRIEGVNYLHEALSKGKGAFLLTLHLGNGDFGCMGLAQAGLPMNLISKRAKQKVLNDIWFELREKLGTKIISHEKSTFDIFKALKRNEVVAFVLDQFMGPPIGVKTRFFGKETGTAQGLALFAQKTGVPVVPAYNYRTNDGSFVVVCEKPIPFEEKNDSEATIQHMTQVYTDKIEQFVRLKPEQWMWIHRRWKNFG